MKLHIYEETGECASFLDVKTPERAPHAGGQFRWDGLRRWSDEEVAALVGAREEKEALERRVREMGEGYDALNARYAALEAELDRVRTREVALIKVNTELEACLDRLTDEVRAELAVNERPAPGRREIAAMIMAGLAAGPFGLNLPDIAADWSRKCADALIAAEKEASDVDCEG